MSEAQTILAEEVVTEEVAVIDKETLDLAVAEREELVRKMQDAEAKRSGSKDGLERIRLKSFADDLREKVAAKEVEINEIVVRLRVVEKEKARIQAEELHAKAQQVLVESWDGIKRSTGYLRSLYYEWPKTWRQAVKFRNDRDMYHQLCREHGLEAKPFLYKGRADVTQYCGKQIQNPHDMLHRQTHWEAFLRDMTAYGRDMIDGMPHTSKKELWKEPHIS